jgi:hypothetical protein
MIFLFILVQLPLVQRVHVRAPRQLPRIGKKTKDHDLRALDARELVESSRPDPLPECAKHKKPFEFFDRDCQMLLCVNCGLIDHRGHLMVEVADEARVCRDQITMWLTEARRQRERLLYTEAQVAATRDAVLAARDREAQAIHDFCDQLRAVVTESEATWLKHLVALATTKCAHLDIQAARLASQGQALQHASTQVL